MATYDGTVLAVVHDRYFVDRFATAIWVAEAGTVRPYLDRQDYLKVRAHGDSEYPLGRMTGTGLPSTFVWCTGRATSTF